MASHVVVDRLRRKTDSLLVVFKGAGIWSSEDLLAGKAPKQPCMTDLANFSATTKYRFIISIHYQHLHSSHPLTMADSDSDYDAGDLSGDDTGILEGSTAHGTRSTGPVRGAAGSSTR